MQKLHDMMPGQAGKITGVQGDTRFISRVTSVGLTLGSRVEMLRNERKYPLLIYSRDSVIALNRQESGNILVEVMA